MKYIFFGSPRFAAIILEKLISAGMSPVLVVCNPDRPVGRKKILTPPLTKMIAQKNNISVYQPEKLGIFPKLVKDVEFGVLAAYSNILSKEIINFFPRGIVVVHPSLLPKYRGATPIQSAILTEEKETGTTLFMIDEKVDHGPIIATGHLDMAISDNYETLEKKLAELSGDLLVEILPKFAEGKMKENPQDENQATFTKKFSTEDAYVNLEKDDSKIVLRKIKAFVAEPGAWTMLNNKRMKILDAEIINGKIKLKKIQMEGEKPKILQ